MDITTYLNIIKRTEERVLIFGAGKTADIINRLMINQNISVEAFLVSDMTHNLRIYKGKKVCQADQYDGDKNKAVLVAVLERGKKEIKCFLEKLGYTNIIELPEGIMEFDPVHYKRARTPVIEVTAKIGCAVNCKYCPQSKLVSQYYLENKTRKNSMTIGEYKQYLGMLPSETIIDFSGFIEPFLVKDSVDMMEYTFVTCHDMTLFTTLRGLSVEEAFRVLKLPFQFVCLHLPDKDGYADIPITSEYIEVLNMFLDAKKESGEPFVDSANCQSEAHPKILDIVKGRLKIYCEMTDRAGNLNMTDNELTHRFKEGELRCSRAFALNHNVLLPDGTLVLCCNDFGLEYEIGNLNNKSYEEIMQGDKLREVKQLMNSNKKEELICRKCIFSEEIVKRGEEAIDY